MTPVGTPDFPYQTVPSYTSLTTNLSAKITAKSGQIVKKRNLKIFLIT
jgi:hypothetical protein